MVIRPSVCCGGRDEVAGRSGQQDEAFDKRPGKLFDEEYPSLGWLEFPPTEPPFSVPSRPLA
jgi:hypothetical protein